MKSALIALAILGVFGVAYAQVPEGVEPPASPIKSATLLPDISVVGDMKGNWFSRNNDSKGGFSVDEIELSFQGYLYPQIRADVFTSLSKQDDIFNLDVEEAYLTFSGISEDIGAKLGRKHLNFGKQNVLHPEQWRMIDSPAVMQQFLGSDGLSPEGLSLDYLLPLPWFAQVEAGTWKATVPTDPDSSTPFSPAGPMTQVRMWTSIEVQDSSELELGASALYGNGPLYKTAQDTFSLLGVDATFKLWPAIFSRWMLQTEAMFLNRTLHGEQFNRWGTYVYLGYRADKYWEVGARADYSQSTSQTESSTQTVSGMISNRLTETTKARLQYTYDTNTKESQITLQFLFGLGPHSHVLQ